MKSDKVLVVKSAVNEIRSGKSSILEAAPFTIIILFDLFSITSSDSEQSFVVQIIQNHNNMAEENIPQANQVAIRQMIIDIRGVKVILDRDIAKLYGVTTGNLNKAVKRNIERFPERFMFQLTAEENLLFQYGISSWGGTRTLPYAFTEQGVAMLSSVLHSPTAIQVSISIIDAFVALRALIADNQLLRSEIKSIELQLKLLQNEQNENLGALNDLSEDVRMEIANIYQAIAELSIKLEDKQNTPRPKIGFKRNDED